MTDLSEPGAAEGTGHVVLHPVASLCGVGDCPTVYVTDRNTVVVQGYPLSPGDARMTVPSGESLVEIPRDLLAAAVAGIAHP